MVVGGRRRFKFAPGVLTAIATHADVRIGAQEIASIMLHGLATDARIVLRGWASRDCEDPEAEPKGSAAGYRRSLVMRLALRDACA